jgi:coproporphyrinogen III oxidase-like Fe-S oxidoreductase
MKRRIMYLFQYLLLLLAQVPSIEPFVPIHHDRIHLVAKNHVELADPSIGLYIHIPFCRRRCFYCNFAIVPIGNKNNLAFDEMGRNYTNALRHELQQSKRQSIQTVYFGGGTPSLAPLWMLQELVAAVRSTMNVSASAEWTIEMDPGTFDRDKLQAIRQLGFNRISLGVQSLNDTVLESLGRVHRKQHVDATLEWIQDVYGEDDKCSEINYSLDLISGVPGMSLEQWKTMLQDAVELDPMPRHLSLYDLQIESGTVFGKWYGNDERAATTSLFQATSAWEESRTSSISKESSRLDLPSEQVAADMYKYAANFLCSKGYEHYEVSSYALLNGSGAPSPYRSQHNQIYWSVDGQWCAYGLGATSFVDGLLQARPKALADYVRFAYSGAAEKLVETPSDLDFLMDVTLKRLRTADGLSLDWVRRRFECGGDYVRAILKGAELGLELGFVVHDRDKSLVRLTDPDGFLFSNTIISSIFVELEAVIA